MCTRSTNVSVRRTERNLPKKYRSRRSKLSREGELSPRHHLKYSNHLLKIVGNNRYLLNPYHKTNNNNNKLNLCLIQIHHQELSEICKELLSNTKDPIFYNRIILNSNCFILRVSIWVLNSNNNNSTLLLLIYSSLWSETLL